MDLVKFDLIVAVLAIVVGATIWAGTMFLMAFEVPFFGLLLLPFGIVVFIVLKVVGQRVGNKEEDHYDRIEH